jgi:hypothetical protein
MTEMRNPYKILVGEPKKRRPLVKPMHRWDNIKMHLKETRYEEF